MADAASLATALLDLLAAGTADLTELPTGGLQALHDALGRMLLDCSTD